MIIDENIEFIDFCIREDVYIIAQKMLNEIAKYFKQEVTRFDIIEDLFGYVLRHDGFVIARISFTEIQIDKVRIYTQVCRKSIDGYE